jgi:hypothetical protein
MTTSQCVKGERLRALHESPGCFVFPNPWDAGTAKFLESLGFQALATTSAAIRRSQCPVSRWLDGRLTQFAGESLASARSSIRLLRDGL